MRRLGWAQSGGLFRGAYLLPGLTQRLSTWDQQQSSTPDQYAPHGHAPVDVGLAEPAPVGATADSDGAVFDHPWATMQRSMKALTSSANVRPVPKYPLWRMSRSHAYMSWFKS